MLFRSSTKTEIVENGLRYAVDFENGQKTGFFLDQKYNRRAVAKLARGRRVLDCFTHTGSFALNCALGGAEHVTAVDVSEAAVGLARENAVLNGLEGKMDFLAEDVFELLPTALIIFTMPTGPDRSLSPTAPRIRSPRLSHTVRTISRAEFQE